jgi:prepilin signal peptidase PulO-like enzyme (type II secretory pathway)
LGPFFTLLATQSVERDILAAIIGLCVGSFLNVLALRTLAEKPFWQTLIGSSACPGCDHRLGPLDLIPILSYIMLGGKCRYCKQQISWSYPVVEVVTAIAFVVVLHHYQVIPGSSFSSDDVVRAVVLDCSMLVFLGILIAVCVTDFKEKLIPHEITYPSILIGIAFSAWARQDLMPTLAAIGISYILFDFLAFYGLKAYYLMHRDAEGAKQLDHAVRAVDGDTLATVRVAKIEDAEQVIHVRHSEHSQVSEHSERSMHAEQCERSEHSEHAVRVDAGHASALHQLEEAAVRSAMFAEVEDAVPDRVIILAEPGEALAEALPEQKQSTVSIEPSSVHLVSPPAIASLAATIPISKEPFDTPDELDFLDPEIDEAFGLIPAPTPANSTEDDEDFEVMGGGDAVLAALIAAWLGLENLGLTLVLGFMLGSLMGSGYLAYELHKLGRLNKALKSTGLRIAIVLAISEGAIFFFASSTGMTAPGHENELRQLPWITLGVASIFGGILWGTLINGRENSKPFPFGPALAAAAVVAVFADPFHKIIISEECLRFGTALLDMMGHN